MPPKRRSARDATITNTRARKATKILEPTPEVPEHSINIVAVETDQGSDADLDAEVTANILNLATKRKPTPHRTEPLLSFGAVRNIARRLFVSQEEDEPTEAAGEEVRQPEDQITDEASGHFPNVQAPPVTETPAKRALDQVSDVETPAEDEPTHKRGKGRGKGKQPLVAPRTTDGQTLQVVVRNHPGNMPSSSPKNPPGRKPTKRSQRNLKGRAAKSKKAASPVSESPADNQQSIPDQPARRTSPRKTTTRVSAGEEMPASRPLPSVAPLEYEEGITEILMNPSPVKVTRQNPPEKSRSNSGRPAMGYESLSDGERENPVENGAGIEEDLPLFVEDDQQGVSQKQKEDSVESTELHSMVVDAEHFESLIEKARRVGQTQSRTTKHFADVSEVSRTVTQGGAKIHRRLDTLVSEYEKIQSSKSEGNEDSAKQARETIATKLQSLTDYATRIVSVKLNGKANAEMVMKLLRDLYFFILPDWLDCIKLASECYDEDGSMSTRSLKEMHAHLKSWCELAESAVSQPTSVQPKGGYQTSKPTREILPQIHKLRRSFHTKISAKSDANPIARALRLRIEREKKLLEEEEEDQPPPSTQDEEVQRLKLELAKVRREKEERAERARRQRIHEIHRRQAEQIREALEWQRKQDARFAQRAREKLERGSRGYSRSRSLQHRLVDLTREEEGDDDPFADDYQVRPNGRTASINLGEEDEDGESYEDEYQLERVEVFPHNNKSRTTPMPWSDHQKLLFVSCMIRGGRDKYERAAEKLQCSMDEVFAAAKELQEAHDKAHAAGQLNGPDDGWTYDVWVEQG